MEKYLFSDLHGKNHSGHYACPISNDGVSSFDQGSDYADKISWFLCLTWRILGCYIGTYQVGFFPYYYRFISYNYPRV
jgi:hypothetical protein